MAVIGLPGLGWQRLCTGGEGRNPRLGETISAKSDAEERLAAGAQRRLAGRPSSSATRPKVSNVILAVAAHAVEAALASVMRGDATDVEQDWAFGVVHSVSLDQLTAERPEGGLVQSVGVSFRVHQDDDGAW